MNYLFIYLFNFFCSGRRILSILYKILAKYRVMLSIILTLIPKHSKEPDNWIWFCCELGKKKYFKNFRREIKKLFCLKSNSIFTGWIFFKNWKRCVFFKNALFRLKWKKKLSKRCFAWLFQKKVEKKCRRDKRKTRLRPEKTLNELETDEFCRESWVNLALCCLIIIKYYILITLTSKSNSSHFLRVNWGRGRERERKSLFLFLATLVEFIFFSPFHYFHFS